MVMNAERCERCAPTRERGSEIFFPNNLECLCAECVRGAWERGISFSQLSGRNLRVRLLARFHWFVKTLGLPLYSLCDVTVLQILAHCRKRRSPFG